MSETANPEVHGETTEHAAPPKKSKLKAVFGTIAGTLSAGVMAWLSPLVTNVAKPPKPVANFAVVHKGLDVTFQNRSTGGSKLCWDFGDDTALEFLPSSQAEITHTYPKTGRYHVKLTISNILGDQNERTVDVDLSDSKVAATAPPAKPDILDLHKKSPGNSYAPATIQFEAIVDNAQNLYWDFGDSSPVQQGGNEVQHSYMTPAQYRVRLTAYNGDQHSDRDVYVSVQAPPSGAPTYSLTVRDQGTPVDIKQEIKTVSQAVTIQPRKGPATVEQVIAASPGYEITRCELKQSLSSNVQRVDFAVAPDRKSVKFVAHLTPTTATAEAVLNQKALIEEQRRSSPTVQPAPPVVGTLTTPGTTTVRLPPAPENWIGLKRTTSLQIADGNRPIWSGNALPNHAPVKIGAYQFFLTASLTGDKLQIQISQ